MKNTLKKDNKVVSLTACRLWKWFGGGNMSTFTHVDIIAATNCIIGKVNAAIYRAQALQKQNHLYFLFY